jgi:hypothetical protein
MQLPRKIMSKNIPEQTMELAYAMPPIVLDRLMRMARLGVQPSSEDIQELNRMWAEKGLAISESHARMLGEIIAYQQQVLSSASAYWSTPWMIPAAILDASLRLAPTAAERIVRHGMTPIHDRVMANADRLNGSAEKD